MKENEVAIIGTGVTPFGDLYASSIAEIATEALYVAIKDSGIEKSAISSLLIGNMGSEFFNKQEHMGNLIASTAGVFCPSFKIEADGASGAVAMRTAKHEILSGRSDIVAVVGVEKMTELTKQSEIQLALASGMDVMWETNLGGTIAAGYALMANAHIRKYGTTERQLAQVAVKNHANASLNPQAQFKNTISIEQVMRSKIIADPIKIFEATAACDGAASIIMANLDVAQSYQSDPVKVKASKFGFEPMPMHRKQSLTSLAATKFAANRAYEDLQISPKDIDFAEVHDIFTIAEILAIESLGFVPEGEGGKATEEGLTALTGEIPINTSGGLKGRGAPLGASGVAQAIEVYLQLHGKAGARQLKNANLGLSHSLGGTGGTSVVTVYSK